MHLANFRDLSNINGMGRLFAKKVMMQSTIRSVIRNYRMLAHNSKFIKLDYQLSVFEASYC